MAITEPAMMLHQQRDGRMQIFKFVLGKRIGGGEMIAIQHDATVNALHQRFCQVDLPTPMGPFRTMIMARKVYLLAAITCLPMECRQRFLRVRTVQEGKEFLAGDRSIFTEVLDQIF